MKNKFIKSILLMGFVVSMVLNSTTTYLADESQMEIPVLDDSIDYSEEGDFVYTYEDGFIIQSYSLTDDERELSMRLQRLHTHVSKLRHVSVFPHTHSITNVKKHSVRTINWYPSSIWVENTLYKNEGSYPTVSWTTSQSTTVAASVSTSVGVTDSVVSTTLGSSYTKSHTISTSTTISYGVPYQKAGRIRVRYNRDYKTFTCVTTYYSTDLSVSWEETGAGNALGKPYNIAASLETKNIN